MIQINGGDRLRMRLIDRMSTVENGRSSVTLEDILMSESPARNQLNNESLDVMRRDRRRDKTAWKSLRDKLRLKRTNTSWITSNPIPTLDNPIPNLNNNSHRFNGFGFLYNSNRSNGDVSDGRDRPAERHGRVRLDMILALDSEEVQPPRISLMELLEDNDGQMYDVSEREQAEAEAMAERRDDCSGERGMTVTTTVTSVGESGCCVCMIRNKGAAFIPCGHTFCRLCSRELWVQRGNCPLCNTTILQVLDIF